MRKAIAGFLFALVASFVALAAQPAWAATTYKVDKSHSSVGFVIGHLVIAEVEGRFDSFEGTIVFDEADPTKSSVQATAQTNSINTNEPDRDKHLRSADFLDVEKFPTMTFKSSKVVPAKDGKTGKIHGTLELHGVKKEVVLDTVFKGKTTDPWGNQKAVFEATGKINRGDFGLKWNKVLDAGGLLVGEEVTIKLKVEAIAQKS
ncbi:MAG: polyisoprenoid-binding protein [Nitrospirae bacterium]|nr:polyisoprenoid-binding protein [Nitrospirota bacterium]